MKSEERLVRIIFARTLIKRNTEFEDWVNGRIFRWFRTDFNSKFEVKVGIDAGTAMASRIEDWLLLKNSAYFDPNNNRDPFHPPYLYTRLFTYSIALGIHSFNVTVHRRNSASSVLVPPPYFREERCTRSGEGFPGDGFFYLSPSTLAMEDVEKEEEKESFSSPCPPLPLAYSLGYAFSRNRLLLNSDWIRNCRGVARVTALKRDKYFSLEITNTKLRIEKFLFLSFLPSFFRFNSIVDRCCK